MIRIDPISPILLDENEIVFDVSVLEGSLKNPEIKLSRWAYDLDYPEDTADAPFGDQGKVLGVPEQITLDGNVATGANTLFFNPENNSENGYAVYEVTVQGTGSNGNKVTSGVGFIQYREFDYSLDVSVCESSSGETAVTSASLGDTAWLFIDVPEELEPFDGDITTTTVELSSGSILYKDSAGTEPVDVSVFSEGSLSAPFCFTEAPKSGRELVTASGILSGTESSHSFFGKSENITFDVTSSVNHPQEKIALDKYNDREKFLVGPNPCKSGSICSFIYRGTHEIDVRVEVYDNTGNLMFRDKSEVYSNKTSDTFSSWEVPESIRGTFVVIMRVYENGINIGAIKRYLVIKR